MKRILLILLSLLAFIVLSAQVPYLRDNNGNYILDGNGKYIFAYTPIYDADLWDLWNVSCNDGGSEAISTTTSGAKVTSITSYNNKSFTQGTSALEPLYQPAIQNGLPGLHFLSSNGTLMQLSGTTSTIANPSTFIIVVKVLGTGSTTYGIFGGAGTAQYPCVEDCGNCSPAGIYATGNTSGNFLDYAKADPFTTFAIISFIITPTGSTMYLLDGLTSEQSGAGATYGGATSYIQWLGIRKDTGAGLEGYICWFGVFSDGDLAKLIPRIQYLKNLYNL